MNLREQIRRLSGDSLIYGGGQALAKAVNLLLVPVLTRVLLPQQFGVGELVVAYSQSLILVLVFGMDGALVRFLYEQGDHAARVRMVSSSLRFRLGLGLAAAGLLALAAGPVARVALGGEVYAKYLRIGAVTIPFTLLTLFWSDVLRVTFQPVKFAVLQVVQTVAIAAVTLYLVLARDLGVAGVLYGRLAGDALAALVGLVLGRHYLTGGFDGRMLRTMLGYGAPLVPVAFAYGWIGFIDRYTLQHAASLDEVGVYGVAMRFFAVVSMGVSAFQLAFMPFAFARAREPGAPVVIVRVASLFVAVGSVAALAAGLFAPEALRVLAGPQYAGAARPAMWLAFAAVAQGAYYVAALGVSLALRNPLLGLTAGGSALAAWFANLALVPRFGAEGAAAATFIGFSLSAALTFLVSQRHWPLPYRPLRLAAIHLAGLAIGVAVMRTAPEGAAGWAVRLAALAAHAVLAWSLGLFTRAGTLRAGH